MSIVSFSLQQGLPATDFTEYHTFDGRSNFVEILYLVSSLSVMGRSFIWLGIGTFDSSISINRCLAVSSVLASYPKAWA